MPVDYSPIAYTFLSVVCFGLAIIGLGIPLYLRRWRWAAAVGLIYVLFGSFWAYRCLAPSIGLKRAPQSTPYKLHEDSVTARMISEAKEFKFDGKWIHPKLVRRFSPWLSDFGATVLTVDVSTGTDSNEYSEPVTVYMGYVKYYGRTEEDVTWFQYHHIGVLADGTHVLRTFENDGGTGVYETIEFVRLDIAAPYVIYGYPSNKPHLVMSIVGEYSLRDRDDRDIVVKGNSVTIGPSKKQGLNKVVLKWKPSDDKW